MSSERLALSLEMPSEIGLCVGFALSVAKDARPTLEFR
jgi:hypothetical protein